VTEHTEKGHSALLEATYNGHADIVKELLGCDASHDEDLAAAVSITYDKGFAGLQATLQSRIYFRLRDFVQQNNRTGLSFLLRDARTRTESLDTRDPLGCTLLWLACWHGHRECAEVLLNAGAFPDATDNFGWSPLLLATVTGQNDCAQLLSRYNATFNAESALLVFLVPDYLQTDVLQTDLCQPQLNNLPLDFLPLLPSEFLCDILSPHTSPKQYLLRLPCRAPQAPPRIGNQTRGSHSYSLPSCTGSLGFSGFTGNGSFRNSQLKARPPGISHSPSCERNIELTVNGKTEIMPIPVNTTFSDFKSFVSLDESTKLNYQDDEGNNIMLSSDEDWKTVLNDGRCIEPLRVRSWTSPSLAKLAQDRSPPAFSRQLESIKAWPSDGEAMPTSARQVLLDQCPPSSFCGFVLIHRDWELGKFASIVGQYYSWNFMSSAHLNSDLLELCLDYLIPFDWRRVAHGFSNHDKEAMRLLKQVAFNEYRELTKRIAKRWLGVKEEMALYFIWEEEQISLWEAADFPGLSPAALGNSSSREETGNEDIGFSASDSDAEEDGVYLCWANERWFGWNDLKTTELKQKYAARVYSNFWRSHPNLYFTSGSHPETGQVRIATEFPVELKRALLREACFRCKASTFSRDRWDVKLIRQSLVNACEISCAQLGDLGYFVAEYVGKDVLLPVNWRELARNSKV
jgi:hypothetical protein